MSKRHQYFKSKPQVIDTYTKQWASAESLSRADFGVKEAWARFPKWQERWLINFYQDWFESVESLKIMWNASLNAETTEKENK